MNIMILIFHQQGHRDLLEGGEEVSVYSDIKEEGSEMPSIVFLSLNNKYDDKYFLALLLFFFVKNNFCLGVQGQRTHFDQTNFDLSF